MCGPAVLPALAIASGVITAGAQVYSGMASNQNAKYQARVAEVNADHELAKRSDANRKTEIEQMRHWRQASQRMGLQRAQLAASGVDVNFGSAADLQSDTAMLAYEDSQIINDNYINEVRGYEINATNYKMQAKAKRMEGKGALIGGILSGAGTLLSTASQVGKMNAGARG